VVAVFLQSVKAVRFGIQRRARCALDEEQEKASVSTQGEDRGNARRDHSPQGGWGGVVSNSSRAKGGDENLRRCSGDQKKGATRVSMDVKKYIDYKGRWQRKNWGHLPKGHGGSQPMMLRFLQKS